MKIVTRTGSEARDVDVALDGTAASVADLARALDLAPPDAGDGAVGLVVDGFFTPGDLAVTEAGIHEGAEVRPAGTGTNGSIQGSTQSPTAPRATTTTGAAELCVVAGLDAGRRVPLTIGSHLVGRGRDCDVTLSEATVSRHHCQIEIDPIGQAQLTNLSERGTLVNGKAITDPVTLSPDAVVEIGSIAITVRAPIADDRPGGVDRFRDLTSSGTINFNRPPRFALPGGPAPLAVPKEPDEAHRAPFNIAAVVAPAVMGLVMVLVLKNALYAMFALLSPLMMLGNWWETRHRSSRALRRDTRKYREALDTLDQELEQAARNETHRCRVWLPDPAEVLRRATAPSFRLWERRPDDDDFLRLAAGIGDARWQPPLTGRPPNGLPEDITKRLARHAQLPSLPVEVDLAEGGVVGIVGERSSAVAVARCLLTQAAVHHGPADLRVVVIAAEGGADVWDWVKWLPHTRDHRPSPTERRLLGAGPDEASTLLDGLLADAPKADPGRKPDGPTTLYLFDGEELLAGRNSAARSALRGGGGPAAGIVLASAPDRLPALCTSIVSVDEWGAATLSQPRKGSETQELLAAGLTESSARDVALALARFEDPEIRAPGANLPDLVPLAPLLDLDPPTAASVADRWRQRTDGYHLRAPIGVSETGEFWLDLDRHGPHGLIGGTTGSGKSELLKTLVAALAATYAPSELTFGLFDFKGGSTFTEFANLPHTVGMASDLDVHLAQRALQCLRAELLHRERLFDAAGVKDLADYRSSSRQPAIPRLVVIIDEFAAMASELAEEIGALTDLTARGRSLGVHLLLATQKPSTAINSEIRTNTRLRISLQVEDKQDSVDVIGIPDAASIRQKGRAFFRVGQTDVVALQTALSTGSGASRGDRSVKVAPFVFGRVPRGTPNDGTGPAGAAAPAGPNDLVKLVDTIRETFAASGQPPPRRPWPDPLPATLPLSQLETIADSAPPGGSDPGTVYFALADDPARQTRYPAGWTPRDGNLLIYGVVGSGTTTALASLGLAFCATRSPDQGHLYVLDFGSGALAPLEGLPHCGAVIPVTDRERQIRLIRYLRNEMERRRKLGPEGRAQLSTVLVLIDNVEAFRAEYEDAYGLGVIEQALRLFADGPDAGIYLAATATRLGGVPAALSSATPQKLVLRLSDASDYGAFSINRRQLPTFAPGRGLFASTAQVVQVALPAPDLRAAVEEVARTAPAPTSSGPAKIGALPPVLSHSRLDRTGEVGVDAWRLPLGLSDEDLGTARLVLYEHEHALVAGPARSGRSTALLTIAKALRDVAPGATVVGIAGRRSPLRAHPLLDRVAESTDEIAGVVDSALVATGPTLVLVDDCDSLDDAGGRLAQLLSAGRPDLHMAAAGRSDVLRTMYGHWTQVVRRSKAGVLLQPNLELDGELLGARLPRRLATDLPAGRGFLVGDGRVEMVQIAQPGSEVDGQPAAGQDR